MNTYHGIGLMSGTSLDGVDIAFCQFVIDRSGVWSYQIEKAVTRAYPEEWRRRLATVQDESAEIYARTDVEYGHHLGALLQDFIASHNLSPQFVASHGHTIFHQPGARFTGQIGDGETMAAYLPCPLVTNFRNKDVALGGQGAPLVPFGEEHLFPDTRLFLNLGGFSNLSHDGAALDVSPCNFALNWAVRELDPSLEFDPDGQNAREGKLLPDLLKKLNALDYYHRPAPKSLGREWFEEHFLPLLTEPARTAPRDVLHTLCEHIAEQIFRAAEATKIRDAAIIVTGGGSNNRFLADLLEEKLGRLGITFSDATSAYMIDYKEALIFAFLGLHVLVGRSNTLPKATGARAPSPAGSIHLPIGATRYPILTPWE
jgi:anhydro-N-acetylmuramic acid kinase